MRLQRLEIKGFKSFANETVINFDEDVIGVVGPNGAGKSNLVDAIRWVLGEQKSKELRLDKMSDIIFNGAKNKKKGGVAQVVLTFENTKNLLPTEYQTVSIGRYLYRSGESEYKLNNVSCRLKDIRSLFLDTGIGSNSYAIIALGMVEDILSDKENARRRMFEQAAGISKYKARKKETLNKLNSTQTDLDRIEDLLFEIEQNLKVLEKQARRTQRYFDLKEKYKALSIQLAVIKIKDLKEKFNDLSGRVDKEIDTYRQIEVKIRESEAALEALKQKHVDKEKSLSEFQRNMNELIGNIRTAENDKKIYKQKGTFLEQSIQSLEGRLGSNENRLGDLKEQISVFSKELELEVKTQEKLQVELTESKKQLTQVESGHGDTKLVLDEIMAGHQEKQDELISFEKELVANQTNFEITGREIQKLEDQARNRNQEFGEVEGSLEKLHSRIEQQDAIVKLIEEEEFKRLEERAGLEEDEDNVGKALNDLNRKKDARQHEYDLIKSLVDKLEGFPDSIKFLNKNSAWGRQAPLLSDLIYCVDPHRVVIESYLDNYLNHYVVDTVEDAASAINLLSDAQKGRANFFILEAFSKEEKVDDLVPGLTSAIDVVEVEPKYVPVVRHLLANVYISNEPSFQYEQGLSGSSEAVILSSDGKFIRGSHTLSGGSVGLFEGKKLGRKKYLKKLEGMLTDLTEKVEKEQDLLDVINDKLVDLDSRENVENIEAEKKVLEEMRREEVYLNSRLEHFRDLDSGSSQSIKSLRERLAMFESAITKIEAKTAGVRKQLEEERAKMSTVDDSFQEIANQLADQTAMVNQQNIELIRHQSKIQSVERERSYTQHQVSELTLQAENDGRSLLTQQGELKELTQQIEELDKALREHYGVRKSRESDLSGLEQSYYSARGEITELEDTIRSTHRKQTDQQQLINDLKDSFTEVKFRMSNVGERLKIEFDIALEDVLKEEAPVDVDLEELDAKVEKMRNRINNYGEINPMAVDAYEEMNERYETITTQRDDIITARDSLMATIEEIENTATELFLQAFSQVREYFIEVFRSLFTEDDTCDLILLDPESPLTSAIEIIAKPKGKRPKALSQLSGGEKTLTAIALLFGLYLLKPAPFCIFDEVDAPLDDTNIEKFNKIVKKFSKKSQFIVVTHNKLTMAAVDVIYGVYMEEMGVSNVSQVDFRTFKHSSLLEVTN